MGYGVNLFCPQFFPVCSHSAPISLTDEQNSVVISSRTIIWNNLQANKLQRIFIHLWQAQYLQCLTLLAVRQQVHPACKKLSGEVLALWDRASALRGVLAIHTHPFNGPFSGTTWVSRYQKGKPIWILLKQETEWQWHQLGRMQICTSLQTDNHASTRPLSFLKAGCPSCRPTNSVKALKTHNNASENATSR